MSHLTGQRYTHERIVQLPEFLYISERNSNDEVSRGIVGWFFPVIEGLLGDRLRNFRFCQELPKPVPGEMRILPEGYHWGILE